MLWPSVWWTLLAPCHLTSACTSPVYLSRLVSNVICSLEVITLSWILYIGYCLLWLEDCVSSNVMYWNFNSGPWVGLVHEDISFIIRITVPIKEALEKVVKTLLLGQQREAPSIEVSGFPWTSQCICCLNHRCPTLCLWDQSLCDFITPFSSCCFVRAAYIDKNIIMTIACPLKNKICFLKLKNYLHKTLIIHHWQLEINSYMLFIIMLYPQKVIENILRAV